MSDYTAEEIASAVAEMQANGASAADIAQAAADAGVSISELSAATGYDAGAISQVYQDSGIAPAPESPAPEPVQPAAPDVPPPGPVAYNPIVQVPIQTSPEPSQPEAQQAPAPAPAPVAPNTMQDTVNNWFQQNPTATPQDVLNAVNGAGGLTPDIAAALATHYGSTADAVTQYFASNTPAAPVAPSLGLLNNGVQNVGGVNYDNSPVGLGNDVNMNAPTPKTADLGQYNNQTQQGIQRAGLDTTMNTVVNNGNLSDIINQGLTPQAVSQYKDASGNMITAAPNTFVVSNPDGSGGALNYFFTVDPKTGATAPIANPGQNLTYSPGSPGGFINGLISSAGDIIKTVAPIALDVALIANGINPAIAGAITGGASAAANGGNIIQGALAGGAAGYTGGLASGAVGSGAPIASGVAGGAAAGATNAALTGQDILKGAATGGIIGGGAGYANLGTVAEQAQTSSEIQDALAKFNAANPGASAVAQADFLSNDPDLGGYGIKQITTALGADSPVTQAAAVMQQSAQLNAQEVTAGQQTGAGTTTTAPAGNPAWMQPMADAYAARDYDTVSKLMQANGLTADDVISNFKVTDPNTISLVKEIELNPVTVTASNAGTATTTPGVVVPGSTPSATIPTVNVTGSAGSNLTTPETPAVTPVIPTVTVVGTGGTGLTTPPTPPVTPIIPTVTVVGTGGSGLVVPPTPPVVPPVVNPPVVPKPPQPPQPPVPPTPPVVPIVTPKTPTVTQTSVGPTTLPATVFGTTPTVNNPGYLNPGLIQAQTYYKNDTSPVQAQYYWGAHPFQYGPTFNAALYNQVPGGTTPWGLQQMGTDLTTAQLQALINGQAVTPGVVGGPVAPTAVKA
jgi:hypothetical protein